jgi:hypothetical protein
MDLFNPSYFPHVANILLLVAYSVRDILWLRLFAVAASLISLRISFCSRNPCGSQSFGVASLPRSIRSSLGVFLSSDVQLK